MRNIEIVISLQTQNNNGSLAEWLGAGLQNRLRRFESARNLFKSLQSTEIQYMIARIFTFGLKRGLDIFNRAILFYKLSVIYISYDNKET